MAIQDERGRPLRSLRISVTDRCNLRCTYCMPEAEYAWIPRAQVLTFEEIDRLLGVFCGLGVRRVRVTGGEPLLRRDLHVLIERIVARPAIDDVALTTNGYLLADRAAALVRAGLGRVTVSLDTLRDGRFGELTRRDGLPQVLAGIRAAREAGLRLKLNMVVIRGFNDDEMPAMLDFGRGCGAEVRFIEYMDVGGATRWSPDQVVSRVEMLSTLTERFGTIRPVPTNAHAPAERFRLADGSQFGIIASTTDPFCDRCDRSRLTADGMWYLCLYATDGVDLKGLLRGGATDDELAEQIASVWRRRTDRGAQMRLALEQRGPFVPLDRLQRDVHLEMHTRGG